MADKYGKLTTGRYSPYQIDTTTVWTKIADVTLSDANDYTISSLNGNNFRFYNIMIIGTITASSDKFISVRPNNSSSSYLGGISHLVETGIHGAGVTASDKLVLGRNAWSHNGHVMIDALMDTKTGRHRVCVSTCLFSSTAASQFSNQTMSSVWTDTSANITSLVFNFDGATNFAGNLILFGLA